MADHKNGPPHLNGHPLGGQVRWHHNLGVNSPISENDMGFLEKMVDLILEEAVAEGTNEANKVVDFVQPEELEARLDLSIDGPNAVADQQQLLDTCRDIIKYSVRTGHPMFFNQFYQGMDAYGLGGAWMTEALNTNCFTHEVAPVFLIIERLMLEKIRRLIAYPVTEAAGGDGIFCPGGSMSNMFALSLARFKKFPDVKAKGMKGCPEMVVFTSADAHYSLKKGMFFLGFGTDALVMVECDEEGRMSPPRLEEAILSAKQRGATPVMVNATSGTTVMGAYDPLGTIADICRKHDVWMHVDACWGGGALVSTKHKHLMDGIEKSDSMAWNFHKMLGSPLQCSPFVTQHHGLLRACHSSCASYLFQSDKNYDTSYDIGDKSILCGRKVDALKIWMMWKAKGDDGLAKDVDHAFGLANYIFEKLRRTAGFRSAHAGEPMCTNVCFWYIPKRLRHREDAETPAWWQEVGEVAPHIKKRMMERGSMLIGYQPLGEKTNFFRLVIGRRPNLTVKHMDKILEEIAFLGEEEIE